MKYSLCIAALLSVASAYAIDHQARARETLHQQVARQTIENAVDANVPAMSDANGNVVPFNTANVNVGAAAKLR